MAVVIRRLFQPWSGVIGGAAGWYVSQQAGSEFVFAHCGSAHAWVVIVVGVLGLLIDAGGALLSWQVWREEHESGSGRQFVGLLGLLIAAALAFPILMQILAGLLVPGCGS